MNILRDNFTITVLQHDKIFIVGGVVKGLYLGTRNDMEYLNFNVLGLTEGGKQSKKRSAENMIQNEVSSEQPTRHRGRPYQNPVKVEEDGEVNEISQASNEVSTGPPLNNHNEIPKYSSAKTLHQRVAFLEESLGLKDNSSNFKRRVE